MDQNEEPQKKKKPWYLSLWVIVVLVLFIPVLIFANFVLGLSYRFKKEFLSSLERTAAESEDVLFPDLELTGELSSLRGEYNAAAMDAGNTSVLTGDDPFFGVLGAPITIVAFEDFECQYCRESFPVIRRILSEYQDKIYFVYRDFPVIDIHPHAQKAAEAGECAHEQEKFWPYHDKIFQNQPRLSDDDLLSYARQAGLDMEEFKECFESRKYTDEVQEDFAAGVRAGVRGTPTFFVNGRKIEGVIPYDAFKEIMRRVTDAD